MAPRWPGREFWKPFIAETCDEPGPELVAPYHTCADESKHAGLLTSKPRFQSSGRI